LVREREIERICEFDEWRDTDFPVSVPITNNSHQIQTHRPCEFIPISTRERLKEIIRKSQNPQKSLAYFHSKFADFLNQGSRVESPRSLVAQEQLAPVEAAQDHMAPVEAAPVQLAPAQAESEQFSHPASHATPPIVLVTTQSSGIAVPSLISPIQSEFTSPVSFPSEDVRQPLCLYSSPKLRSQQSKIEHLDSCYHEIQTGATSTDRKINVQSIHHTIKRFYAGSNHRIKLLPLWPTNSPSFSLSNVTPQHLSSPPQPLFACVSALLMADLTSNAAKGSDAPTTERGTTGIIAISNTEVPATNTTANINKAVVTPSHQGKGKEIVMELGTEKEKKALVVNMARARGAARKRFLAVGIFLSTLLVTSRTLIDNMRIYWKIRGHLDMNQLQDRRFVLEFSEEGDYLHVTKGGPWKFKNDAVLVDELKEGDEPESVPFNTIPIWLQFKNIPFYLLSKQLARNLGTDIGELISIDNNARGDICAKILRARVQVPITQALRRWITLQDKIGDEEVIVSVAYERLPNFCHFCGFIGHQDADCMLPANERKKRYSDDLRVAPTHPQDPRRWFLPEFTGQERLQQSLPWRSGLDYITHPTQASRQQHTANIGRVAHDVGKLSIHDKGTNETRGGGSAPPPSSAQHAAADPMEPTPENSEKRDKEAATTKTLTSPTTRIPKQQLQYDINKTVAVAGTSNVVATTTVGGGSETRVDYTTAPSEGTATLPTDGTSASTITHNLKTGASWKRMQRLNSDNKADNNTPLTTQGCSLGARRSRPEVEEDDQRLQPTPKKILMQIPTLEECLGKECLAKLRQEEEMVAQNSVKPKESVEGKTQDSQESESLDIIADSQDNQLVASAGSGSQRTNLLAQLEQTEEVAENTLQKKGKKSKNKETGLRSEGMKLDAKKSVRRNK
jgi:hypothetical protein